MQITSWNILHGQSLKPAAEASFSEVAASLDSDLIALQEIDYHLPRSQSANQVHEIAEAMKAPWWGFAPAIKGTPGVKWRALEDLEERVLTELNSDNQGEYYGIAIASKIPVEHWLRLELGKSWIGLPLLVANEKGKVAPFYVKDEPRVALAAVLDNGWTVINTHLSFVPLVNIFQLFKITRWAKKIERRYSTKVILLGDFNLPWGLPTQLTRWKRATDAFTYPSWKPQISFDYILARSGEVNRLSEVVLPDLPISDHRPIAVTIA